MTKRNEIDPEAAFYVQLIFQWELMGVPIFEIARRMTLLQVPTPREWHRKIEGKEVLTCKKWGVTTIRHILENQTYAGDTINNKSTQKLFAGQDNHDLPKEQWYDEKAKKPDCLTDMPGILPDQYAWNLVYVDL
ncbi:MAG: recombinase family protein [Gemmiger sp.]